MAKPSKRRTPITEIRLSFVRRSTGRHFRLPTLLCKNSSVRRAFSPKLVGIEARPMWGPARRSPRVTWGRRVYHGSLHAELYLSLSRCYKCAWRYFKLVFDVHIKITFFWQRLIYLFVMCLCTVNSIRFEEMFFVSIFSFDTSCVKWHSLLDLDSPLHSDN